MTSNFNNSESKANSKIFFSWYFENSCILGYPGNLNLGRIEDLVKGGGINVLGGSGGMPPVNEIYVPGKVISSVLINCRLPVHAILNLRKRLHNSLIDPPAFAVAPNLWNLSLSEPWQEKHLAGALERILD